MGWCKSRRKLPVDATDGAISKYALISTESVIAVWIRKDFHVDGTAELNEGYV